MLRNWNLPRPGSAPSVAQQIFALRRENKLIEALNLALNYLQQRPGTEWDYKALGYVLT